MKYAVFDSGLKLIVEETKRAKSIICGCSIQLYCTTILHTIHITTKCTFSYCYIGKL